MEADEAWDLFKSHAATELAKSASVAGQMDTMAAQLQNIQTGVDRLTTLIPKLMGDEAALDEANASAEPSSDPLSALMGGAGLGTGEDMPAEEEDVPAEDEEDSAMSDEEKPTDEKVEKSSDEEDVETPVLENESDDEAPEIEEDEGIEDIDEADPALDEIPVDEEDDDVSDLDEEIDIEAETPPLAESEGAGDIYAQILRLLVQAAMKASENGREDLLDGIAKSVNGMQAVYGEACPYLDEIYGTDTFSKSFRALTEDDVPEEDDEELEKSLTGAEDPDDMIEKASPSKGTTKMPDVEDAQSETATGSAEPGQEHIGPDEDPPTVSGTADTKVGPVDLAKSRRLPSIEDIMSGQANLFELSKSECPVCGEEKDEAKVEDSLSKEAGDSSRPTPDFGGKGAKRNKPSADEPTPGDLKSGLEKCGTKMPKVEDALTKDAGALTTADETAGALAKSMVRGKHLVSIEEMMGLSKSHDRPDAIASVNGDIKTPALDDVLQKSHGSQPAQFGSGYDIFQSVQEDWKRYNAFKAGAKF